MTRFTQSQRLHSVKIRRLTALLLAAASFCCVFLFLITTLPGIHTVVLDMDIDHADSLKIYYSKSKTFTEGNASHPVPIGRARSKIKISIEPASANSIRIDTGDHQGTARIYQLEAVSYFGQTQILGPGEIQTLFTTNPADAQMQVSGDHLDVIALGNDPYIVNKHPLFKPMYGATLLLSLLFSAIIYILAAGPPQPRLEFGTPPSQSTRSKERLSTLDGLRGVAAIFVIADHTMGWFSGIGATGVWIFFALSGFLLARPFTKNPNLVLSPGYMAGYMRRRFLRILPMYYTYIFVVFIMSRRLDLAFLHALFIQGNGHLWAIPQEILFYLLLPCVVVLIAIPLQKTPRLIPIAICVLMIVWNQYVDIDRFWLLGMNYTRLRPYFGVFLAGVLLAFFKDTFAHQLQEKAVLQERLRKASSPLGLCIIVFFTLFSTGHIFGSQKIYSQEHFAYFGLAAAFLIVCTLSAKQTLLESILTFAPLRALGLIGLSVYLVHPLIKIIASDFALTYFNYPLVSFGLFLATLCGSTILGVLTYTFIEKPGLLAGEGKGSAAPFSLFKNPHIATTPPITTSDMSATSEMGQG